MAHLKKSTVTGHLLKNATTGHLVKSCGTNCAWCDARDEDTPYQYAVVLSGVVPCVCPRKTTLNNSRVEIETLDLDPTFLLTQSSPCTWSNDDVGSFVLNYYLGTACWTVDFTIEYTIRASLDAVSKRLYIASTEAAWRIFDSYSGPPPAEPAYAFGSCLAPDTAYDNGLCSDGSDYAWSKLCKDGVATITPVNE